MEHNNEHELIARSFETHDQLSSPFRVALPHNHAPENDVKATLLSQEGDGESGDRRSLDAGYVDKRRPPSTGQDSSQPRRGNPWQPGVFRRLPYLSAVAIGASIACMIGSILIVTTSNHTPIDQWAANLRYQPAVWLASLSTVSNILLGFAMWDGLTHVFWWKAGRGTTLVTLHNDWEMGNSAVLALLGLGRLKLGFVGLVCLIVTISKGVRGPVLQRAVVVENVLTPRSGSVDVQVAQQLPNGYTGWINMHGDGVGGALDGVQMLNDPMNSVLQDYRNKVSMVAKHSDCGDQCTTTVKGLGFNVSCVEGTVPFNLTRGTTVDTMFPSAEAFNIDITLDSTQQSLLLNATFKNTTDCFGLISQQNCTLQSGITSYRVRLSNGTVDFQDSDWRSDHFLEAIHAPDHYAGQITFGGFALAASYLFGNSAWSPSTVNQLNQSGGSAAAFLGYQAAFSDVECNGISSMQYLQPHKGSAETCTYAWANPMDDMIKGMRELALRISLRSAADNASFGDAMQTTPFVGSLSQTVYKAEYRYLAGYVVVSVVSILAVLPLFWGWWELGRSVSLNPLEIANAFNAPLLEHVDDNGDADSIVEAVGKERVMYGYVPSVPGESVTDKMYRAGTGPEAMQPVRRTLAIANDDAVMRPRPGDRFGYD